MSIGQRNYANKSGNESVYLGAMSLSLHRFSCIKPSPHIESQYGSLTNQYVALAPTKTQMSPLTTYHHDRPLEQGAPLSSAHNKDTLLY